MLESKLNNCLLLYVVGRHQAERIYSYCQCGVFYVRKYRFKVKTAGFVVVEVVVVVTWWKLLCVAQGLSFGTDRKRSSEKSNCLFVCELRGWSVKQIGWQFRCWPITPRWIVSGPPPPPLQNRTDITVMVDWAYNTKLLTYSSSERVECHTYTLSQRCTCTETARWLASPIIVLVVAVCIII